MYNKEQNEHVNVYQIVTDEIVKIMESGKIPWNEPYLANMQAPMNLITGKPYRGINRWLLWHAYDSPYYLTYNQAKALGGNVKRGEKSHLVTFWKRQETIDKETGEPKTVALLRYYRVFNVSQCEGIKHSRLTVKDNGNRELLKPSAIVKNMPNRPVIKTSDASYAYYRPSTDTVHINGPKSFKTSEAYHATLFHELAHATGHGTRLDRELKGHTEKASYSREELIAEFASAFLCEKSGISKPTIRNAAAYIQHWKTFLQNDPKAVVSCASKAEKAADYILGTPQD